jgi:hypothetical protein
MTSKTKHEDNGFEKIATVLASWRADPAFSGDFFDGLYQPVGALVKWTPSFGQGNAEMQRVPARQSRNEAGTTDRKIAGQKNGMPVYLYVPHFSVSRYSIGFPRSLRAISTIAVQRPAETSFSLNLAPRTSNLEQPGGAN